MGDGAIADGEENECEEFMILTRTEMSDDFLGDLLIFLGCCFGQYGFVVVRI